MVQFSNTFESSIVTLQATLSTSSCDFLQPKDKGKEICRWKLHWKIWYTETHTEK